MRVTCPFEWQARTQEAFGQEFIITTEAVSLASMLNTAWSVVSVNMSLVGRPGERRYIILWQKMPRHMLSIDVMEDLRLRITSLSGEGAVPGFERGSTAQDEVVKNNGQVEKGGNNPGLSASEEMMIGQAAQMNVGAHEPWDDTGSGGDEGQCDEGVGKALGEEKKNSMEPTNRF